MTKKMLMAVVVMMMSATTLMAQNAKVADKELVGVWLMESMQWERRKENGLRQGLRLCAVQVLWC